MTNNNANKKPKSQQKVREVSSRLLQPTASQKSRNSEGEQSARQRMQSSQRKREEKQYAKQVAQQALEDEHSPAATPSHHDNNDNNSVGGGAAAAASATTENENNIHDGSTTQQQHLLPALPESLKHPTHNCQQPTSMKKKKIVAGNDNNNKNSPTPPDTCAKNKLSAVLPTSKKDPHQPVESHQEGKKNASTAAAAPTAVPGFMSPTRKPRGYVRAAPEDDDDDCSTATRNKMPAIFVPVPSPFGKGSVSKRIRPSARALNVYAADDFHRAEKSAAHVNSYQSDEGPLLVIRRFDKLDDTETSQLLDINMDGNAKCVSARRPAPPAELSRAMMASQSARESVERGQMAQADAAGVGDVYENARQKRKRERHKMLDGDFLLGEASTEDVRQQQLADALNKLIAHAREMTRPNTQEELEAATEGDRYRVMRPPSLAVAKFTQPRVARKKM